MRDSVIKIVRRASNKGRKIFRIYLTFIAFLICIIFIWGLTNVKRELSIDDKIIQRFEYSNPREYLESKDAICGLDITQYKIDLRGIFEQCGEYFYRFNDGKVARLTLNKSIQEILKNRLNTYKLPFAGAVIMDAQSGRILGIYESKGQNNHYSLGKTYKSASIFKIITMEAILSDSKINTLDKVCYHGGRRRLNRNLLIDNPKKDHRCMEIDKALGYSANVIFARLAYRYLDRDTLVRHSLLFGFDERLPVEFDTETSNVDIPDNREELAYTAAGFGETYISVLHGAVIASIIANKGMYIKPSIIEDIRDLNDNILYSHSTFEVRRVMKEDVAIKLGDMMRYTVTEGTAHKFFARRKPVDFIGQVPVAGKTGSLADRNGEYTEYNWFVGFAPSSSPRYVISVLTINSENISARAVLFARKILDDIFTQDKPQKSIVKSISRSRYLSKR
ncbi:MAG: penicillin-binding transpeptidase domain-containing protein [Deltaproteobacteria bacterium]|nr:penicillin-binding transpeptidase domain-containing protein [Deltaproteobacteria bacterium]